MKTKKIILVLVAGLSAAWLTVGCLNYDERITVNPDGSGTIRICLSISEEALSDMDVDDKGRVIKREIKSEEDLFPRLPDLKTGRYTGSGKKYIIKEFSSTNCTVRSVRAESVGGMRKIYVVADFKDFNKLSKSRVFADRKTHFKKLPDGSYEIRQVLSNEALGRSAASTKTYQLLRRRLGDAQARSLLSSYFVWFTLEGPAPVAETKGAVWKKTKAKWSHSLLEVMGSGRLDMRLRTVKE